MKVRATLEVYIAGDDFTEAISRGLGTESADAEQLKLDPQDKSETVEESLLPTLDDLGNEIHLSFDYYENQYDREVDEVYISGGSCQVPGLQSTLERVFDRRIFPWDPTENLEVKADQVDVDAMKEQSSKLAVAVGLASRILG